MEIKTINANELHALRSSTPQVLMLDVRTPGDLATDVAGRVSCDLKSLR